RSAGSGASQELRARRQCAKEGPAVGTAEPGRVVVAAAQVERVEDVEGTQAGGDPTARVDAVHEVVTRLGHLRPRVPDVTVGTRARRRSGWSRRRLRIGSRPAGRGSTSRR